MKTISTQHKHNERGSDDFNLARMIYILQGLAFLFGGITLLIALVMGYLNLEKTKGTWLESHFVWQLNTCWIALIALALGLLTIPYLIGYIILSGGVIWVVQRIIYGWIQLNKDMEI